jgi:hypothetical protein
MGTRENRRYDGLPSPSKANTVLASCDSFEEPSYGSAAIPAFVRRLRKAVVPWFVSDPFSKGVEQ